MELRYLPEHRPSMLLLYFEIPDDTSQEQVKLTLYQKSTYITLPNTEELIFLHTKKGPYFPHDLLVWTSGELLNLYQQEVAYQQTQNNDISKLDNGLDLASVPDVHGLLPYAISFHTGHGLNG